MLLTDPCQLPDIPNGTYKNGYKKGLMITHDASVEYSCDSGFQKTVDQISCHLGAIVPEKPSCERVTTVAAPLTTTSTTPQPSQPSTKVAEKTNVATKSLSSDDAKAQGQFFLICNFFIIN